jgi:flagellin
MSLTLNTNIDSLNAQRNLTTSQASLSQSLERLSSGLRINSAADDAAGLAISNQFSTQINGTNQAVNNANDAISEAQTAGGALSTLTDNLQSIRTLAVEAANGSNSPSDRAALDQEVQQQIAEVSRIAAQTSFNGTNVLNGSSGVTNYQVGANVGDTISINLTQGVGASQIGQIAQSSGATPTSTVTAGSESAGSTVGALSGALTLAVGTGAAVTVGASVAGSLTGQTAGSAYAKAAAINAANISGLTASASTSVTDGTAGFSTITAGTAAAGTYDLTINGTKIYAGTGNIAAGATLNAAQVAAQINLYTTQDSGVTASVNGSQITLTAADGSDIDVTQVNASSGGITGTGFTTAIAGTGASGSTFVNSGKVTLTADSNIAVGGSTSDIAAIGQTLGTISLGTATLANANVLTVSAANATIYAVDAALATVSQFQSQLGAIQNRFTSTVANLQSTAQNLTSSRSTIQDADFASETANLTQSQVLQQAGISVLSQANQEPQLILKLLQ